jgi:hypothetical protein
MSARLFSGPTEGVGRLKIRMRRAKPVRVHGTRYIDGDSTLLLDKQVETLGKPNERRSWRIERWTVIVMARRSPMRRYPFTGDVIGNRLHLRPGSKGHKGRAMDLFAAR